MLLPTQDTLCCSQACAAIAWLSRPATFAPMPRTLDARSTGLQSVGNATFFQSVVNVINILSGVGLLSLPFALRKSGWAGLVVLWLMGFVTNYTGARRKQHCAKVGGPLPSPLCCDTA